MLAPAIVALGCGGAGAGAHRPAPQGRATPGAAARPAASSAALAPGAFDTRLLPPGLLDVPPGPDPTLAFRGTIPEGCAGAEVDLRRLPLCHCQIPYPPERDEDGRVTLRASMSCGEGFYGRDLTRSLAATLTAEKPRVLPGERVLLSLAFQNVTNKDLGVVFRSTMAFSTVVEVWGEDGAYRTFGGDCGTGGGAGAGHYMVLLAPGGTAVLRGSWSASTAVGVLQPSGDCLFHQEPLPAGKYRLSMRAPIEASQKLAESVVEVEGTIEVGD